MRSATGSVKIILTFLAAVLLTDAAGAAGCRCPPGENVRQLATTIESDKGQLVACGQSETSIPPGPVRVSSLEIYNCQDRKALLDFDAAETELLYTEPDRFRVVLVSSYPAGVHWQRLEVPVAEWVLLPGEHSGPVATPQFPKPLLTASEISTFVRQYQRWLAVSPKKRDWSRAEDIIAKLATAAFWGDPRAIKLFLNAHRDAGLDAGIAETWGLYEFEYRLVHPNSGRSPN